MTQRTWPPAIGIISGFSKKLIIFQKHFSKNTSTLWQRCQYNIHGLFGHELTIQRQGNVEATLQFWRRGISVATMCSVCTTLRPNHKHCHSVFRWWVSYFSLKYNWRNAFFFAIWVFIHKHSQITGLQGKWGGGISLTLHYHFHPLQRHLNISRANTAESSPLHIASSRTRTGNLWFPSASR